MDEESALGAFQALSGATRLRILKLLVTAGDHGILAGQISDAIGASPSRTSFHLSTLANAGLVQSSRNAKEVSYRIDFDAMGALMRYILEDCCQGNATVAACCAPRNQRRL